MKDIQIFKLVDVFDHSVVSDTLVGSTRTVRLKVSSLTSNISEVTVNGYLCTSFSLVSTHQLDVVIPVTLNTTPVYELTFLILGSVYSDYADYHEILFDLGKFSKKIYGHDYLLQIWLRFFVMSPGSDAKDRSAGVGVLQLAGKATAANLSTVRTQIARMVQECKQQIISRQLQYAKKAAASEILSDARLTGIRMDEDYRLVIDVVLTDGNGMLVGASTRV